MPILSNPRHERFAQELASGKSATEAYVAAGYEDNRQHAHRLVTNGDVRNRVAELQQRGAAKAEITIESLVAELEEIRAAAKTDKQYAASVSAITAKAKLAGLWVEKRENLNRNADPRKLPTTEINRLIAAELAGRAEDPQYDPGKLN